MEDTFVEGLRSLTGALFGGLPLAGHRDGLRFLHVAAFVGWAGPAMGASWFVYAAAWEARRAGEDAELERRVLWVRRQFNRIVALEHLAFATLVVTGLMLAEAAGWAYAGQAWFGWKLALVFGVFIPMELLDVVLSAWFQRVMKPGASSSDYGRAARWQDLFLRATIPPVMIGIPLALYLAVAKPL